MFVEIYILEIRSIVIVYGVIRTKIVLHNHVCKFFLCVI